MTGDVTDWGASLMHVAYEMATPNVIAEYLDGELLIVNLANGVYFRGEAATGQAWAVITSGANLANLAGLLAFAEQLRAEGLIRARATVDAVQQVTDVPAGPFPLERFDDLQDMLAMDPIHDVDPSAGWPHPR